MIVGIRGIICQGQHRGPGFGLLQCFSNAYKTREEHILARLKLVKNFTPNSPLPMALTYREAGEFRQSNGESHDGGCTVEAFGMSCRGHRSRMVEVGMAQLVRRTVSPLQISTASPSKQTLWRAVPRFPGSQWLRVALSA